tara:strand:- start:2561 stop:2794 length:234 start_codon:yes stop_codon:yes gene_type:complete
MSTREMELTELDYLEVKDAVKKVKSNMIFPCRDSMITLLKFYKRMNPRAGVCFSCPAERAKILKYAVNFIEQWQINQ